MRTKLGVSDWEKKEKRAVVTARYIRNAIIIVVMRKARKGEKEC